MVSLISAIVKTWGLGYHVISHLTVCAVDKFVVGNLFVWDIRPSQIFDSPSCSSV
jgi:hypothetical protein